ncbi:MAG: cadherin-like beta sandwich domain-containing protein [Clostridia bacterium]|nr:cadherin-like beta sandwich domain-containing protein [Clostridia bacterium]
MKKIIYIVLEVVIFMFILSLNELVYGVGRIVDIPIPPDSSGYTDFSSEDGEKLVEEYKEEQEKNNITAEQYLGKSNNNFLNNLEIEGFKISPEFDSKVNEYTVDLNNTPIEKLNIIAQTEDENATIKGDGQIKIGEENIININVIAENGNLNVYTINLKNKVIIENKQLNDTQEKEKTEQENNIKQYEIPIIIAIIFIFTILIFILIKNFSKGRHSKS